MTIPNPSATPQPEPPIRHQEWHGVSRSLIAVELISNAIFLVIVAGVAAGMSVLWGVNWQWIPAGIILLVTVIGCVLVPRRVRAIGYQLRADDLLFKRGIMWQRMVAVPYGRMQLIDINRGPLARAFKLAELKFVTASASTGVVIPGLPDAEVESLRDYLVEVAESRRTGL